MGTRLESTLQPQLQQTLPLHYNNVHVLHSTTSCSEGISTTSGKFFLLQHRSAALDESLITKLAVHRVLG